MCWDTFCLPQDTFDVTLISTRKHENEIEWLGTKREKPFQFPSQRQSCLLKCSQLVEGLWRKIFGKKLVHIILVEQNLSASLSFYDTMRQSKLQRTEKQQNFPAVNLKYPETSLRIPDNLKRTPQLSTSEFSQSSKKYFELQTSIFISIKRLNLWRSILLSTRSNSISK